jgi:Rrf2 family transcriptional regulator, iron-sulfur cluster assembly transcription factor
MKFSTQEEYGLRCLLRIARDGNEKGLTIPEISEAEGLTPANAAKLLRIMRLGGLLESARGQVGGYNLSKPADKIYISDVLNVLGGRLYDQEFCNQHTGSSQICTNSIDCSIRSLWQTVQDAVDNVTHRLTLKDLINVPETLVTKIATYNKDYIDIS